MDEMDGSYDFTGDDDNYRHYRASWRSRGRGRHGGRGQRGRGGNSATDDQMRGRGYGEPGLGWGIGRGTDREGGFRRRPGESRRGRGRGQRGRGMADQMDGSACAANSHLGYGRGFGRYGRRGPRHNRGGDRYQVRSTTRSAPLTSISIHELATLDSEVLVKRVDSQLKEFQQAIGDQNIVGRPESMDNVVQILLTLTNIASKGDAGEQQSAASRIIAEILSERSEQFHFQLKRSVNMCMVCKQVENYCSLFLAMLKMFESSAWECLPIDELHETATRIQVGATNSSLLNRTEEIREIRDQMRDARTSTVNPTEPENQRDDSEFKSIPLLPEWKEISRDNGIPPEVRPNQVDKPYTNWMQYYDIQFRLIREDFIAPLRRGVSAFLRGDRGKKNRDVKTYSGVFISSQVTTKDKGICFKVNFDVSGFHRVNYNWDHSKRLIFGSLLCFIPTVKISEDSIIFATVTDRNTLDLQRGFFVVEFEGDMIDAMTHCRKKTEFEIVESNSYFGATNPILRSIQKAEVDTMPFTRQLIEGVCDAVVPPAYLDAKKEPPIYDLSCLYGSVKKRRLKTPLKIDVLNPTSWETASDTELDTSQLHAIQLALTQEIAVIQGPPGTGKTYIGLKIVESLLMNQNIWDPHRMSPILVMCYTNHALDQFLDGVIDTESCGRKLQVIRVGGRCKNEKVDAFNLNKIRKNTSHHTVNSFSREIGVLRGELRLCNPEIFWRQLNGYYNCVTFLPMDIIRDVAHPYHFYQLIQMAKCKDHEGKEVEVWLNLWEEIFYDSKAKGKVTKNARAEGEGNEQYNIHKSQPQHHIQGNGAEEVGTEAVEVKSEVEELLDVEGDATLARDDRMIDDDVEGYEEAELSKHDLKEEEIAAPDPHSHGQYSYDESDEVLFYDGEEKHPNHHVRSKWYRKRNAERLMKNDMFKNPMDDEEAAELDNADITSLDVNDRWRLYNYWAEKQYKYLQEMNREQVKMYSAKCRELAELRQLEDKHILEKADVVGMTTTGAAKYQHILHRIKPKIVIIEEAAEVLEAHIVSALSAGTQHLILIGDHKQLRPKPNEYELATKYNLSISLFERLVRNKMSLATLEIQHRMRPEIARLVCPHVYDKLLNHKSVEKYPDVQGISKNLYFIHHTAPESEDINLLSYQNDFEATYIVALCKHLLTLGYSASQITILTPYVGQQLKLRDKMPRKDFEGVRVTVIDNFQGEENDIILFSMVRSTKPYSSKSTIGFLKEDNRVCVSLSRAKHGFYAIGNFQLIRHHSVLWESIITDVESRGCFGEALPLYCCNHPETEYTAKKGSDFTTYAPNGGCQKGCDIRLPCGHSCTEKCHIYDRQHKEFECTKPCNRKCSFNHPCKSRHACFKKCPPCPEMVERPIPKCGHTQEMRCHKDPPCRTIVLKIMPVCGHQQNMQCSTDPRKVVCIAQCSKCCSNGHPCQKNCYESCGKCCVEMEKEMPVCKHKQMVPCNLNPLFFKCRAPCPKRCQNGIHPCPKKCSDACPKCTVYIPKVLPVCGHTQNIECYKEVSLAKCKVVCEKKCQNELHTLRKLCNEEWPKCEEKVLRKLQCDHEVLAPCFKDPSEILCHNPCTRSCIKGHKCPKTCHEECGPCLLKVKQTLSCGHMHVMRCSRAFTQTFKCPTKCSEQHCERGHECKQLCHHLLPAEPCNEPVSIQMPLCSHEQSVPCFMSIDPQKHGYTCKHPCEKQLECNHKCQKKCGEVCQIICPEKVTITLLCGHNMEVKCSVKICNETIHCKKQVVVKITCGHTLQTECWKAKYKSILIKECKKRCTKTLKCGHPCQENCNSPCTEKCQKRVKKRWPCGHELERECFQTKQMELYPCTKRCRKKLSCGHPCKNNCGEPCSTCTLKLTRRYPCGHSSKIPCSATVEEYPCQKKCQIMLSCGHCCSGKCGNCYSSRVHAVCIFDIRVSRYCGHSQTVPCAGLSDTCCHETHLLPCTHGEDCTKCHQVCRWECQHFQCEKECREECDRPSCNKPCDKCLPCGHQCPGVCGEQCLSVCQQCDPKKFMKQFYPKPKQGRPPVNPPLFELSCGHIFSIQYLDTYMEASNTPVMPKQCPKCHQIISVCGCYGNAARSAMNDVKHINGIVREYSQTISITGIRVHGIQRRALSGTSVGERRYVYEWMSSHDAVLRGLQSQVEVHSDIPPLISQLKRLGTTLSGDAYTLQFKGRLDVLSFQLLDDVKSELYRLALSAQCTIARNKYLTPMSFSQQRSRPENAVETVEQYIKLLDPLKDRISEEDYEHYFNQITSAIPSVASLHVVTPEPPPVVKGTWMKCNAGHYYCIPPVCGSGPKPAAKCPECYQ